MQVQMTKQKIREDRRSMLLPSDYTSGGEPFARMERDLKLERSKGRKRFVFRSYVIVNHHRVVIVFSTVRHCWCPRIIADHTTLSCGLLL